MRGHKRVVRIRCKGGTSRQVKVSVGGKRLDGVTAIEILPIKPGGLVEARITLITDLDLEVEVENTLFQKRNTTT